MGDRLALALALALGALGHLTDLARVPTMEVEQDGNATWAN